MKQSLLIIAVFAVLIVVSFIATSNFLSGSIVSTPDAKEFCSTWGRTSCQQAGRISENWGIELDLVEDGVRVRESCLGVLKCDSCSSCGFL